MTSHAGPGINVAQMNAHGPMRWRLALVGILALAALGWSAYLGTVSLGWVKLGLCSSGSCSELVLSSSWSRWMGVPVSLLAMSVYTVLICVLPFAASSDMVRRRTAWSVLVVLAFTIMGTAIWFVGLMAVHLHKSCGHCASMHLLGMVITGMLITLAPMGRQAGALRPRRVFEMAVIGVAAAGLLAGGQIMTQPAEATPGEQAVEQQQPTPSVQNAPAVVPEPEPAQQPAAEEGSALPEDQPDPNTPEGKAALVAQLKRDYGDQWDKPTTTCQLIPYFLSRPRVRATENGLYYEALHEGAGPLPKPQDRVRVHFQGRLWTGEVFQDTFASGRPQDVRVGDMIPGLREALVMMPLGSRWRVLLVPHLAYGSTGLPGVVPPGMTVFCEVELLDILPSVAKPEGGSPLTHQEPR